jgi:hypothetical protein
MATTLLLPSCRSDKVLFFFPLGVGHWTLSVGRSLRNSACFLASDLRLPNRDSYIYAHRHRHSYGHTYTDTYSYGYSDSYSHCYSYIDTNEYAETYTYAQAAADP